MTDVLTGAVPKNGAARTTAYTNDLISTDARAVQEFIAEARAAFETETTIGRILGRIEAGLKALLARPDCLDGLRMEKDQLGSWKLWVDPDHLFAVHVSHHPPRHRRGPHDHGELGWAVYGVFSGEICQQLYERLDDGSERGRAKLRALPLIRQRAGDATLIPVGGIHAPISDSDTVESWNVVIRSRDLSTIYRNRYDVEKGLVVRVRQSGD